MDNNVYRASSIVKLVAGLAALIGLCVLAGPVLFSDKFQLMLGFNDINHEKKIYLLNYADIDIIRRGIKNDAESLKNGASLETVGMLYFPFDAKHFSPQISVLRPSGMRIFIDSVQLEFGGAFSHYGYCISEQPPSFKGYVELEDEFWFYAEDGDIPFRNKEK